MGSLRAALGLSALLLVAGCAGSTAGDIGELSVTPAPVPTDGTPTPAYRLAPGLAESGVVNPLALATAHAEQLDATAYHVRIEERVRWADGQVRWRVLEGTFANRTAYAFEVREGVDDRTVLVSSYFADGERLYQRLATDRGVGHYVPRDRLGREPMYPVDPLGSPSQFDELYVALVGSRPEPVGTERVDGLEYYRLRSSGGVNDEFLAAWKYVETVSGYEFEAVVSEAGLVREYRISYVATVRDGRREVTRTARWTGLDDADVVPPAWLSEVENRQTP